MRKALAVLGGLIGVSMLWAAAPAKALPAVQIPPDPVVSGFVAPGIPPDPIRFLLVVHTPTATPAPVAGKHITIDNSVLDGTIVLSPPTDGGASS